MKFRNMILVLFVSMLFLVGCSDNSNTTKPNEANDNFVIENIK
jgi:hypothetical protein